MYLDNLPKDKKFDLLLLFVIICLVFRGWFYPGVITHGDWGYYFKETMLDFLSLPYAWQSRLNSAPIFPFSSSNYPIIFLFGLLANLGLDFGISERILYHWPILFLSMFSIYYLTYTLFKNRVASFFSGILFALNTYVLILSDHLTIRMAYSLAPIIFAFFIKNLDSKRFKDVIIISMLFALSIVYEPRISYITLGILLLYVIYRSSFSLREEQKNLFQFLKNFLLFSILTFLLQAYWIIPYLFKGMTNIATILPSQPWISWMNLTNAITLSHPFYSLTENIRSFVVQQAHPIFYSIPILAFTALLLRKDKNVFFFALLSLIGIFLVKQENAPFGWVYTWMFKNFPGFNMFREASKFYLLIALGYSVLFGVTVAEISKKLTEINNVPRKWVSLTFLFLIFSAQLIMAWPISSGNQKNESYYPIDGIPIEYREIKEFIKSQPPNVFRTLWLPDNSRFSFYSDEYPIITPKASEFLNNLLIQHFEVTKNFGMILNLLNVKYVVLTPDLPLWEEKLGEYIYVGGVSRDGYKEFFDNQKDLERIELRDSIDIYENKKYSPSYFEINPDSFLIYGGKNILLTSAKFLPIEGTPALIFVNQKILEDADELVSSSNSLLSDTKITIISSFSSTKNSIFIFPADIQKNNYNPKAYWTSTTPSELYPYLRQFGMDNWDFDYGKGLVFTWATSRLETPISSNNDLIEFWLFNLTDGINQWKNYTRETQFGALHPLTLDNGALKAELWNSTWGWKTINSPLVPIEYSNWYRLELRLRGENIHGAHIKAVEYNETGQNINAKTLQTIGTGNIDWKNITLDYTPEKPETKYIQLQIWHGHETTQPLPNTIWIDDIKVYDLQRFIEPVTLDISYTIPKTNQYILLTRVFQNQQGGKILAQNDQETYLVNTRDQLNKFTWVQLDNTTLQKGQHKITLTNLEGFNAVNLFALVPAQEYREAQTRLTETLQDKRIIHILEAESDMYREYATTTNKYGGEASNGETLEIAPDSKIWREIETVKPGNYTIAVRGRGTLNVKIDEQEYQTYTDHLDWTYMGPIHLEKGTHRIEITSPPTYLTQWNFEKDEHLEWKGNISNVQTLNLCQRPYEGATSLEAELNVSTWGWKTITSPLITVTPDTKYTWSLQIAGENTHKAHIKIVEYTNNKKPLTGQRMKGLGDGNFTWTTISFDYTPSQNATYIALQIWHGHETTQLLPNKIWLDNVQVTGYQPSDLDVVWIYSTNKPNETLEDIFRVDEVPAELIEYTKIDPTKYTAKINATKPFMLSFAESYDPLWVARVDGEKISSIPLYSVINGFWIEETGLIDVTIEYEPQRWFYIGSAISVTTLIACATYLTHDWTKNKNILKRVKKWLRSNSS